MDGQGRIGRRGDLERRLHDAALSNATNRIMLERLPDLALPDCWLVAGCVVQALWNQQCGRAADHGVKDYDVFYYDSADLSYEAEDAVIKRVDAAFADLGSPIEVKNQARVHLWYGHRFGGDYPPLSSSVDGIGRFLIRSTCVAIGAGRDNHMQMFAAYGLDELFAGLLVANSTNTPQSRFGEKAESYRVRWPHLRIVGAQPGL